MSEDTPAQPQIEDRIAPGGRIATQAAETVFGRHPPDWYSSVIREGLPARQLLNESEGAEMLVVGSRGLGGFAGLLLGSVRSACAEHAKCPVLVVHPKPETTS